MTINYRSSFTVFVACTALVVVYATSHGMLGTLLLKSPEVASSVQQVKSLEQQADELLAKYAKVATYATPGASEPFPTKLGKLNAPVDSLKGSSDEKIEAEIIKIAKDLIVEIATTSANITKLDTDLKAKTQAITTAKADLAANPPADEAAKKTKEDAIKKLESEEATLTNSLKEAQARKPKLDDLLKKIQGQYFKAGVVLDDASKATAENCNIDVKTTTWLTDVRAIYGHVTAEQKLPTFAAIAEQISPASLCESLVKASKTVETCIPGFQNANSLTTYFSEVAYNDMPVFQTEEKALREAVSAVAAKIYASQELNYKVAGVIVTDHSSLTRTRVDSGTDSDYDDIVRLKDTCVLLNDTVRNTHRLYDSALMLSSYPKKLPLPDTLKALSVTITRVSEWLEGSSESTIVEQVRLFYYPNAMAILQSLRPQEEYQLLNPEALAFKTEAEKQRTALRTLESTILQLNAERNDLQSRLLSIKDDIKRLNQQIQEKRTESSNLAEIIDSQDKEIKGRDAEITKLQEEITKAETAGDTAKKDQLTKQKEATEKRRDKVKEQKVETEKEKMASDNEKTALETERAKLTEEQGELPSKLAAATNDLQVKTKALREQRLKLPALSSVEAEAFGDYVQNEPIYVARGIRSAGSAALRVRFLVYPRSKLIVLRGPKDHVNRVKDMIALFDRPTPQARITLHSLQVNGVDPKTISQVMGEISGALRDAKANMMIVQDTLRNAIVAEVGRCERAATKLTGVSGSSDGIRSRAQVYSREVQESLGVRIWDGPGNAPSDVFEKRWQLSRAFVEMEELAYLINQSCTELSAATQYKRDRKAASLAVTRFRLVATRAAYVAGTGIKRLSRYPDMYIKELMGGSASEHLPEISRLHSEATKFQNVFKHAYKVVRGGESDPEKISNEFLDLYYGKNNHTGKTVEDIGIELVNFVGEIGKLVSGKIGLPALSTPLKNREYLYSITVPDPAKVTTLGEMLFVMSLVSKDSRERILHDFAEQLYFDTKINSLSSDSRANKDLFAFAVATISQFGNQARNAPEFQKFSDYAPYPLSPRSVFGANPFSGAGSDSSWSQGFTMSGSSPLETDETSSNQLEILHGLRAKARRNMAAELRRFAYQIETTFEQLTEQEKAIVDFAVSRLFRQKSAKFYEPQGLKELAGRLEESESLSSATPRVAAADQMIKRFMETFETDFDKFFIDPMLERIRNATSRRDIAFGGYERKSILASNRLLTRVDVSGTANVQVGDQENILAESATLLSLINSVAKPQGSSGSSAANRTGNALADGGIAAGAAKALGQSGTNSLLGYGLIGTVLSSLMAIPEEGRGEIYSIGTGGSFKVTPIFNPSGQGLTFRLDYAQANVIQEPDGTTQLQAPRIDRHTVNTEVQITNLDLGEISSFEANYKLGRGEKTTGGVPILRDLFPTVPIIGWFARSPRVSPVRQHSLIFAQTAMYPTVGDIMDLLVQSPTGGRFRNSGAPDYSNPKDRDGDGE